MFRGPLMNGLMSRVGRLRFPYLFGLTALVFLGDVLVPDLIPFADEVLLGFGQLGVCGRAVLQVQERFVQQQPHGLQLRRIDADLE